MKDKKKRPEPEGSALGVFLTMEELADRLAVSQRTIYRWIRLYGLPSYKFGKTVRFEEKQVSKWIEGVLRRTL
jgi:excisionase family DNA binding protein